MSFSDIFQSSFLENVTSVTFPADCMNGLSELPGVGSAVPASDHGDYRR